MNLLNLTEDNIMSEYATDSKKNFYCTKDDMFELIKAMNTIVKNFNDEMAYENWINLVPDEADDQDLRDISEDIELLDNTIQLFKEIINIYIE